MRAVVCVCAHPQVSAASHQSQEAQRQELDSCVDEVTPRITNSLLMCSYGAGSAGTMSRTKVSVWTPKHGGLKLMQRNRLRPVLGSYACEGYGKPASNKPPRSIKASEVRCHCERGSLDTHTHVAADRTDGHQDNYSVQKWQLGRGPHQPPAAAPSQVQNDMESAAWRAELLRLASNPAIR